VSFPDSPASDEAPLARETARRLGAEYHVCTVDSATVLEWAQQGLRSMDQPALDGLNSYIVSRAVRQEGLVVALSGQGGDELFGGYRSFREVPIWWRGMGWPRLIPSAWRAAVAWSAARRLNGVARGKARDIARVGHDLAGLCFQFRRLHSDRDLEALGLRPQALGLTANVQLPAEDGGRLVVPDDPVATVGRLETRFYLGNTLLRDGDVFGMASSIEIRAPFLDCDVLDWVFRLPGEVLLPAGSPSKPLLRRICADFYTPDLLQQRKRGFAPPIATWLQGPLRPLLEGSITSLKKSGLLEPRGLQRDVDRFWREPRSAAWSRVWSLVTLAHWLEARREAPGV
jgi:asparagine synthase (glutamine-hydrolysing)